MNAVTSPKTELRRQQILDAASECFRKSGFHGASMAEIAKSFGMSCGHIYNYFDSKEAIIRALVERDMEQTLERIASLKAEPDLFAGLMGRVDEGVQRRIDNSSLDTEIMAEASRNETVAKVVQCTDSTIRQELQTLLATIAPPGLSDEQLAIRTTLLIALFDGLMIRAIRDPGLQPEALGHTLRKLIGHLLSN